MRGQIESGLPVLPPRLRSFAITLKGSEADADDLEGMPAHACGSRRTRTVQPIKAFSKTRVLA